MVFAARGAAEEAISPAAFSVIRPSQSTVGLASFYGREFHGHATANGETFDMGALTAAHRSMPLPSYARVTNLRNGRSIVVRVNDRGPYVGGRMIDVSERVAKLLEFTQYGVAKVRLDYLGRAPQGVRDGAALLASLRTGGEPVAAPPAKPIALAAFAPRPLDSGETVVTRVVETTRNSAPHSPFGELQPPSLSADAPSALAAASLRGALAFADEPATSPAPARSPFGELVVVPFVTADRR